MQSTCRRHFPLMVEKLVPKIILTSVLCSGAMGFCPIALAQEVATVVDQSAATSADPLSNDQVPQINRESLPPEQRLSLLEQQMANIVQMNLPSKLDSLQQQLQQLNGQLEVQSHDVQVLNDQLKTFYQDLDQKVKNQKVAAIGAVSPKAATTPVPTATTDTIVVAPVTATQKMDQAQANMTSNVATAQVASPAVSTDSEKKAYDSALDILSKKKNDQAVTAFIAFVKAYPKGTYAPNAHYWLGELYNMKSKKDLAANEYDIVVKQFPGSTKVPDSLLKLATLHAEENKMSESLSELQLLIHKYPHSSAAQQANAQLQALKMPVSGGTPDPD